jgi:hypothetical protein
MAHFLFWLSDCLNPTRGDHFIDQQKHQVILLLNLDDKGGSSIPLIVLGGLEIQNNKKLLPLKKTA